MATRAKVPKLESITTAEILARLKEKDGNNTEFFYLYVSTAGKERKKRQQKAQVLPQGQQQLTFPPADPEEDDENDITDSDEEDDEDTDDQDDDRDDQDDIMDSQDNSTYNQDDQSGVNQSLDSQTSLSSLQMSKDKARQEAMNHVHKFILPSLLGQDRWKKVYDKDIKLTYRALYFNIIEQNSDEDELTFVQRVGQIRHKIADEAKKLKEKHHVNFKINSLLSKPFLYDEKALEEQTMRATQTQPPSMKQRTLDDYQ